MKISYIVGVVIILVFASGLLWTGLTKKDAGPVVRNGNQSDAVVATIYKSPLCGCCVGYSGFLENHGFEVDIVSIDNMKAVKDQYNIPEEMESCHTTVIGNYFIEGHVPLEVVDNLLAEQPDIDGIALPNMPAGTPGMPGVKSGPYAIYQLVDGEYSEYVNI